MSNKEKREELMVRLSPLFALIYCWLIVPWVFKITGAYSEVYYMKGFLVGLVAAALILVVTLPFRGRKNKKEKPDKETEKLRWKAIFGFVADLLLFDAGMALSTAWWIGYVLVWMLMNWMLGYSASFVLIFSFYFLASALAIRWIARYILKDEIF